jgi:hypothetical protein
MSVQIAPHMTRKRMVKDLSGNIIDLLDENGGGWIVKGRQIVNQEKWDELQKKKKDEALAAQAMALATNDPDAPDRTLSPAQAKVELDKRSKQEQKVETLEKKVEDMDSKLDKILNALNGGK